MKGIVSQTAAINVRVYNNISPRLYLFCNFEGERHDWINEDGRYLHNVLTLYKVMIDTNYITGRAREILAGDNGARWKNIAIAIQYDELQKLTEKINCIRSVEAHNVNECNGYFQMQEEKEYDRWVSSVLQTDKPSTEAHYKALNMELEKISLRCESCIYLFLDYVEQAADKEKIVERWAKTIIRRYSQKEEYLYGQMADMYCSLYPARMGHNVPEYRDKNKMRHIIGNWIMNYYIEPFDKAEAVVDEGCREKMKIIKSAEGREALQKLAQQKKDELENQKGIVLREISQWSHLHTVDELLPKHYSCYFLEKTVPELIENLMAEHPNNSLLPQEILQLLVYTYMRKLQF